MQEYVNAPVLVPAQRAATTVVTAPLRVIVAAKHPLVRDAVRTALASQDITTYGIDRPSGASQFHEMRRRIASIRPDFGLLLGEIDDAAELWETVAVITGIELPWVLITGTPQGTAWGAVLESGVHDIVPTSTTLENLTRSLRRTRLGGPMLDTLERGRLLDAWRAADVHERQLTHRVETLSAREMEVLVELHDGRSVKQIAEHCGVSEGTVRAQVKAILRKLGASSQLQAVASYRAVTEVIRR